LLNLYNIPKPAYRAFQLLHSLGDEILCVEGGHETVDAWVVRADEETAVVFTNWERPRHRINKETVQIELHSKTKPRQAYLQHINDRSANAYRLWRRLGLPQYLNPRQIKKLNAASKVVEEVCKFHYARGIIRLETCLTPQSVTILRLTLPRELNNSHD
jgi:xylan 1,4-beta-xylosidase